MISTSSFLYRKAFEQYLRKGTSIEVFLKSVETTEQHSTPLYRWHTAGDAKVRPSHAANAGKIFAWAHPPDTGNPGEEINCRCWAEPVKVDATPLEIIALLSGVGILRRVGSEIVRRINGLTLNSAQAKNLERFNKKLPNGAQETKVINGPNGQPTFRAHVPAKNIPDSYARYEKIVDKAGNTVSYTKTTYAPDGSIVHTKVKWEL